MPITTPFKISESALANFYGRFTHVSKGFNAQYAATKAASSAYSSLPNITIEYDLSKSFQLIEGQWDFGTLLDLCPGMVFPVFQYFCPTAKNTGDEKNHTFGGRIPLVLQVHLTYQAIENAPMHINRGRVSLLGNAIEDTIFAMYATPGNLSSGTSNYQLWSPPQLAPNTVTSTRSDIIRGSKGLAQGLRFDMLWDLQTSS